MDIEDFILMMWAMVLNLLYKLVGLFVVMVRDRLSDSVCPCLLKYMLALLIVLLAITLTRVVMSSTRRQLLDADIGDGGGSSDFEMPEERMIWIEKCQRSITDEQPSDPGPTEYRYHYGPDPIRSYRRADPLYYDLGSDDAEGKEIESTIIDTCKDRSELQYGNEQKISQGDGERQVEKKPGWNAKKSLIQEIESTIIDTCKDRSELQYGNEQRISQGDGERQVEKQPGWNAKKCLIQLQNFLLPFELVLVLVMFIMANCDEMRVRPYVYDDRSMSRKQTPYSTEWCCPELCPWFGDEADNLKVHLRSLSDPRLLARWRNEHQQVCAVPFTHLDEQLFDSIDFLIRLAVLLAPSVQETDQDGPFVSLDEARWRPRSSPIETGRSHHSRARGGNQGRGNCQREDSVVGGIHALPGQSPSGSIIPPEQLGAVGGTNPEHVHRQHAFSAEAEHDEDLAMVQDENSRLRRQRDCVVCLGKPRAILFEPCNHLVCCNECAPKMTTCPVCRADIRQILVVHIPEG